MAVYRCRHRSREAAWIAGAASAAPANTRLAEQGGAAHDWQRVLQEQQRGCDGGIAASLAQSAHRQIHCELCELCRLWDGRLALPVCKRRHQRPRPCCHRLW